MAYTVALTSDAMNADVSPVGKVTRTHTRTYLVKSDSTTFQSAYEAAVALGFSAGDVHPADPYALVRKISPVRKMTLVPQAWDITVEWSTEVTEEQLAATPWDRRVIRSESTSDQERFITKDRNGKMIQDTAGSPFDGGIPVNVKLGSMVFTRNEIHDSQYYVGKANTLSGYINSTAFAGAAAGTLMLNVQATETFEGDFHYWVVTYTMTHDPLGWQPNPLNAGMYKLVNGARIRITENGAPSSEPTPLDAAGAVVPVANRPDSCIFVDVDYYDTMDFSLLGLPLA